MIRIKQSEKGVTLLEVLLVIVIAGMILILGLRQYQSLQTGNEARRIKYNVDAIFVAMSYYYKAECYGRGSGEDDSFKPGKLNPDNSDYQENIDIDITDDLFEKGYLRQALPLIPLLDTSVGMNGFVAQFNMDDSRSRKICIEGNEAQGPSDSNCDKSKEIGKIVTGVIQVSVKMKDQATANTYVKYLGGDCLSSPGGHGTVLPCKDSSGTGTYIVWERLPSFASPNAQGSNAAGNQVLNQFTRDYSTYPAGYLISNKGESPGGEQQYFLCGS